LAIIQGHVSADSRNLHLEGVYCQKHTEEVGSTNRRNLAVFFLLLMLVLFSAIMLVPEKQADRPPSTAADLGLLLLEKENSLYVLGVHENSLAARAGIMPGDLLISVDGQRLLLVTELETHLADTAEERQLPVLVESSGRQQVLLLRW